MNKFVLALTAMTTAAVPVAAYIGGSAKPDQSATLKVAPGSGLEVVELFQSQGCSSCPPANANVIPLAARGDVLVLSWQVTYWDYLGWKDSFAKPAFTQRQHDYASALHHDGVWTPQVVINGRGDVVGSNRAELDQARRKFARGGDMISLALAPGKVALSGSAADASVYLVRYDPKIVQVPIRSGENGGRTLPHRNIVREFARLGAYTGGTREFALPRAREAGLKTAILVQSGKAGPVLAAARD
jgi:hypothetical protein